MSDTKPYKLNLELEILCEGNSTISDAEDDLVKWIDMLMLYQIGYNEVADTKRARIFDYDIRRVKNE